MTIDQLERMQRKLSPDWTVSRGGILSEDVETGKKPVNLIFHDGSCERCVWFDFDKMHFITDQTFYKEADSSLDSSDNSSLDSSVGRALP